MDVVMVADEASAAPALLPWVEKYRPSSLDQLVAHEDIIRMIERMMKKQTLPHMLLHGPPGTGAVWRSFGRFLRKFPGADERGRCLV